MPNYSLTYKLKSLEQSKQLMKHVQKETNESSNAHKHAGIILAQLEDMTTEKAFHTYVKKAYLDGQYDTLEDFVGVLEDEVLPEELV